MTATTGAATSTANEAEFDAPPSAVTVTVTV
jgi:hypothetical protein